MIAIILRILATFLMIGVGFLARKRGQITNETTRQLSHLLTTFFYPALIFTSMTRNFTLPGLGTFWVLPAGGFLIMLLGFALGILIETFIHRPAAGSENAFLFQCTINNYSFLPLPIALMLWGEAGVAGIIFSSLGSELALWTLGLFAISGRRVNAANLKRMISPPLVTIAISILWIVLRDLLPAATMGAITRPVLQNPAAAALDAMRMLGSATIPIAMVMAGSRMAGLHPKHLLSLDKGIVAGLRLLVVPAIVVLCLVILPIAPDIRRTLLLVATMPSAVASVIFAELYNEDAEFAAACILLTHILCIPTIPLWMLLA
ncbi:MAG: AEC family transporter [Kiritimatiellia bacterium]